MADGGQELLNFGRILRYLHVSKILKSRNFPTWMPGFGGLPKLKNFKIGWILFKWTETNIESHFGGYQRSPGYQIKFFNRFGGENTISCIPLRWKFKIIREHKKLHFTVKTVEKICLAPQTALITPKMTFFISVGSFKQVLSDFEIFEYCAWPAGLAQNGRFRDFAILEVHFEDIAHLKNAKISKNFNLEPVSEGVTKNQKFRNRSELVYIVQN